MSLVPLFPLELVVFPLEKLNLHIFEPRYRQLISDCQQGDIHFGIPTYRKGFAMDYGTMVKLKRIEKVHDDGRMDISTEGVELFRINEYLDVYPDKLYPGGRVTTLPLYLDKDDTKCDEIRDMLIDMYNFMNIQKSPKALSKEVFSTFEIAHKVGFNQDQEYEFLQITTEHERQDYLINHLKLLLPVARNMEEMRKKIQLNGHFKDVLPPKI